ncbi:MAG: 3-phosphoshikimate 1-carboxyvinyltransferase [candidate division WOR-3 bacterium]
MPERILTPPPDKSISHRALILSAIASEPCCIRNPNKGLDVMATIDCLRAMGSEISSEDQQLRVEPKSFIPPSRPLNCANSGTTMRLLLGLLSGTGIRAVLDGDESLRKRPMDGISEALCSAGAVILLSRGKYPPVEVVSGITKDITWAAKSPSAQVKSGLLLAGLAGGRNLIFTEPVRTRDHTERLLRWLGEDITIGEQIRLRPTRPIPGFDLTVPGDPSSAAFLVAFRLMRKGPPLIIKGLCLNPTRMGLYEALVKMGARLSWEVHSEGPEPVGDLLVEHSETLSGAEIGPDEAASAIDELTLLGVLASITDGIITVRGAEGLRSKESDRIALLVKNLRAQGAEAEEFPDGFRVKGPFRFRGGRFETQGDHRLAMGFAVACSAFGVDFQLDHPSAPEISYPGFYEDIRRLV